MNGLTRRVLLAGAALLPATSVIKARAANANEAGDSGLLELAAKWWRIENATNQHGLTDDERTELLAGQGPIVHALVTTPAHGLQGLTEKIRIYCAYYPPDMESECETERVLAAVLQDAERLGGVS